MRFGHIEIFAKDPGRSVQFYRDVLGFEVTVAQGERFVWLQKDQLEILIRPGKPPQAAERYEDAASGIVLYADDVDLLLVELEARGLKVKGTVDSDKCYTFTDPDGNWFQIVNPDDH